MILHCVHGNTFLCTLHCPQHSALQCFVFEPFKYLQFAVFCVPGFEILGAQAVAVRNTFSVMMEETENKSEDKSELRNVLGQENKR